jgi:hypothetical protein
VDLAAQVDHPVGPREHARRRIGPSARRRSNSGLPSARTTGTTVTHARSGKRSSATARRDSAAHHRRSKLTNAYFEKKLGAAATTRNWKTVTKLAELASA